LGVTRRVRERERETAQAPPHPFLGTFLSHLCTFVPYDYAGDIFLIPRPLPRCNRLRRIRPRNSALDPAQSPKATHPAGTLVAAGRRLLVTLVQGVCVYKDKVRQTLKCGHNCGHKGKILCPQLWAHVPTFVGTFVGTIVGTKGRGGGAGMAGPC